MISGRYFFAFFSGVLALNAQASADLEKAPPAFLHTDNVLVEPIDIQSIDLELTFDYSSQTARGKARVVFDAQLEGYPILDLVPNPTSIKLNGKDLETSQYANLRDPDHEAEFRTILEKVTPSSRNIAEIEYKLPASAVDFVSGGVRAGLFMTDLSPRRYWEQYGPAGFEYDQYPMTVKVKINGTVKPHDLFVNGSLHEISASEWVVTYPPHFTASSYFFHLTDEGRYAVVRENYQGISKSFPLVVYADSDATAKSAVQTARQVLKELEQTYGPYAHDSMTIYIVRNNGGMEYCGATVTSLWALPHEITHSWFARGVMPASGNSGWIDEAIASWRDDGYPRAEDRPSRSPVNLGGFAPYRRYTTDEAYTKGADLISEFDFMFAGQGGMKPVLRGLFSEFQLKTITVPIFKSFIERVTSSNLTDIFDRYVLGKGGREDDGFKIIRPEMPRIPRSHHPRPFTPEEWATLR